MKVYEAINKVQAALAAEGIGKDSKSTQGFQYRGIDAVYNALAPLLGKHGLCILPRMVAREVVERTSAGGKTLIWVTVDAEFDLVGVEDGSKHTIKTYGEAMDSGDKATNKAMSIAYKYACFQAFAIPTEGDNDPDATGHELADLNGHLGKWLKTMTDATTFPTLQAAYKKAIGEHRNNREALLKIADVKDECKKKLEKKGLKDETQPATTS